jgi:iron complex transport system substrate-binding protein
VETTWERVRDVEPEQLVLMPCGYDAPATAREWQRADRPVWFAELRAAREGELYAVDGSAYFSRPGPRVVEGIALLAELFDPDGLAGMAPPGAWMRVPA